MFANQEEWSPTDLLRKLTPSPQERNRRSWSLAHHLTWRAWRISLGYTGDWVTDTSSTTGPGDSGGTGGSRGETTHRFQQTTIGVRWNLSRRFSLRGNQGEFFRIPTFPELFGQNGLQEGNPNLVPETGPHWDAGFILTSETGAAVVWRIET